MKRPRGWRQWLLGVVAALCAVAAWVVLAPRAVGGPITYVIASGSSMEPGITSGDLALVRETEDYEIGDVAAYRSADLRTTVLHRIVDRKGDRFVFQGDANSWRDPELPTADALAGTVWLRVPKAGIVLEELRGPAGLGAALALLTLSTWRRGHRASRAGRGARHRREARGRWRPRMAFAAGLGLTVGGVALAVVAFPVPASGSPRPSTDYHLDVTTGYAAAAPEGLFDVATVRTGAPVFVQLTDVVTLSSDVTFASDAEHSITGEARLVIRMGDEAGWQRTLLATRPVPLREAATVVRADLDLGEALALVDRLETSTGLRRDSYTVSVVTEVSSTATIGTAPVRSDFAPVLELSFDRAALRLVADPGQQIDPAGVRFSHPGSLPAPPGEPPRMELLGRHLPASLAGWSGVGLAALGVAALCALGIRRRASAPVTARVERARRRYAGLIVEVTGFPSAEHRGVVEVARLEALAALASQRDLPMLEHDDGTSRTWWVVDADSLYRFSP